MLYRPFEKQLNEQLKKHKLHRAQWTILYYLYNYGPATHVEISQYQGVEKPTITRIFHRLEELGYVEQVHSKDKREKKMKLTKLGSIIYKNIRISIDHFEKEILNGIAEERLNDSIHLMEEIRNNLFLKGMK